MNQVRVKYDPPSPLPSSFYHGRKQQATPLTHHEILSLIAPFSQSGRYTDLAASDRVARKLAFKPIMHAADGDDQPGLREDLLLEVQETNRARLLRNVTIVDGPGAGLASTLTAEGHDIGLLLEQIEAVPIRRQVKVYSGVPLVRGYYIDVAGNPASAESDSDAPSGPVLVDAKASIQGVHLAFQADRKRGMPVEVKLTADPGQELHLPEDLLAVIGWSWRPLVHIISYWRGTINVARREPKRTPDIEHKLGRTIQHLAYTLGKSPGSFHQRYLRARWRVTFQRSIPMLIGLSLLAITPAVRYLDMADGSVLRMLIFHAPPILLISLFVMREMPRIEIPPVPRSLRNRTWVASAMQAVRQPKIDTSADGKSRAKPLEAET